MTASSATSCDALVRLAQHDRIRPDSDRRGLAQAGLADPLAREVEGQVGAAPVPMHLRDLIRRFSRENRLWGAPRIQLELERLGHKIAKSTVEKYMDRRAGLPSPTWRAFLRNHAGEILACDLFTIPTAPFQSLSGLVVVELGRRRVVACDVTRTPTAKRAAGVVHRAFIATGRSAKYRLRDRDSIYGVEFRRAKRGLGLSQLVTAYRAPRMNAHVERAIGTIRRECRCSASTGDSGP